MLAPELVRRIHAGQFFSFSNNKTFVHDPRSSIVGTVSNLNLRFYLSRVVFRIFQLPTAFAG